MKTRNNITHDNTGKTGTAKIESLPSGKIERGRIAGIYFCDMKTSKDIIRYGLMGSIASGSPFPGTVKPLDAKAGYPLNLMALPVHKPCDAGNFVRGIQGNGTPGAAIARHEGGYHRPAGRNRSVGSPPFFTLLLTYPLTILFAMAAGTKVMKYATYRSYLHTSGLMGEGAALWVSIGLPLLELAVAAALAWPKTRRVGLVATIVPLPFYHYYIYHALNEAAFLPCGCLGALPITWEQHYILNIAVLAVALMALRLAEISRPGGMVQVGPVPDPEDHYGSTPNFLKRMLDLFRKILPALALVAGLAGAYGFSAKQDPCRDNGHLGYSTPGDGSAPIGTADPRFLGAYNDDFDCVGITPENCHWVYVAGQWQQCDGNLRIFSESK